MNIIYLAGIIIYLSVSLSLFFYSLCRRLKSIGFQLAISIKICIK